MDGLQDSIRALTTQEQWEGANSLFEGGGVMNVRISSRQVTARVVNDQGGLENVLISNRNDCLNGRCSCSLHTQWCKHIIAVLLLIAREEPEFLKNLSTIAQNEGNAVEDTAILQGNSRIKEGGSQAVSVETLRSFLSNDSSRASLKLKCETELPALHLSTQRLVLSGNLNYNGVDYSIVNIRKIVDGAHASGGMNLNVFSPQAQQAMQFLVKYARFSTNEISLDSEQVCDLFHCLLESSILHTPSGVLRINKGQPQLVFNVKERNCEVATVAFSLFISGRGILSEEELHIISGRAGYWFGSGNEFWWLPGIIPFNWLRLFIHGATMQISLDELSRLVHLCESKSLPCRVEFQELSAMTELPVGKMKPVLTLDWHTDGLVADLQFDYGGKRVEAFGQQVLWVGKQFVQRDMDAEEAAMNELRGYGFTQVDDTWHGLRIKDKKQIYHFITQIGMNLSPRWHTFWTPQMRLNAMMASDAGISVSAGNEGNGWFETKCDIVAVDGTPVPFQLAVEALENDDSYIRLPSGAVIHLTDEVFMLLRVLLKCASKRHDNNLDFDKVHSVLLADVLEPYWNGPKPNWCALRDYLLNPDKIGKLVDNRFMPRTLRGYQREGVKWLTLLEQNGFNGILADEMGLGKTIQALSIVLLRKKTESAYGPSLVVCPSSLLDNWHSEARRFTPSLKVIKITGTERSHLFSKIQEHDLAITSYALLRRDILEYEGVEFDYVILDEAQHIKNPKTANAHACRELRARHKLILTGTPMENSLSELWSLFAFLLPGYLGNMREFRHEFEQKGPDDKKLELSRRLSSMIRPFVLRRTKAEVCSELPPKLEQDLYCEMSGEQRRLYDSILLASRAFLNRIKTMNLKWSEQRMEMLAMITRLRQVCLHPALLPPEFLKGFGSDIPSVKMELAKEVILEAIDSGHRILLFSQFTALLRMFPKWLEDANIQFEYMDGKTRDRQSRVDLFNSNSDIAVFLLSLKAGGVGLNLQGADTVIHFDQWWNPMVEDQATDRSHRIGQCRTVTSIRLVTRNTIEEKILKLQDSKRMLFNNVLGNSASSIADINIDDVNFILS